MELGTKVFKMLCGIDGMFKCTEVEGMIIVADVNGIVLLIDGNQIQYNRNVVKLSKLVSLFGDEFEYLHVEEESPSIVMSESHGCGGSCGSCGGGCKCGHNETVETSIVTASLSDFQEGVVVVIGSYLAEGGDVNIISAIDGKAKANPARYYSEAKLLTDYPGVVKAKVELAEDSIAKLVTYLTEERFDIVDRIDLVMLLVEGVTSVSFEEVDEVYNAADKRFTESVASNIADELTLEAVAKSLVELINGDCECKDRILTTQFMHLMNVNGFTISNKLDFFLRKLEDCGKFGTKEQERFVKLINKESKPVKKQTTIILVEDTIEEHIATVRNDIAEIVGDRATEEYIATYQARFDEEVKGMTSEVEITTLGDKLVEEILDNNFDVDHLNTKDQLNDLIAKMYSDDTVAKSIDKVRKEYNEEMGIEEEAEAEVETLFENDDTKELDVFQGELELFDHLYGALDVTSETLDQLDDYETPEELLSQLGLSYDTVNDSIRNIIDEINGVFPVEEVVPELDELDVDFEEVEEFEELDLDLDADFEEVEEFEDLDLDADFEEEDLFFEL